MIGPKAVNIVVLISANIEWQVVKDMFSGVQVESSPLGEWFFRKFDAHSPESDHIGDNR